MVCEKIVSALTIVASVEVLREVVLPILGAHVLKGGKEAYWVHAGKRKRKEKRGWGNTSNRIVTRR